jgi:hypothetical protein
MLSIHNMSLRDWFAGQALQAIVSQQDFSKITLGTPVHLMQQETAKRAYELADAMLRTRGPVDHTAMETPRPVLTPARSIAESPSRF